MQIGCKGNDFWDTLKKQPRKLKSFSLAEAF